VNKLCTFVLLLAAGAGTARAGDLRAGAAAVDITPPEGTPLAGYYTPRGSKTVLDPLFSKALVLDQDGTRVALVVCDLISLPRRTVVEARELIEKQTGIPGSHVMISATHTHTGPVLARDSALDELTGANGDMGRRYTEALPGLIARSVAEANKKLGPAHAAAAVGREEGLSFNRRFLMRDGTVSWNPRKLDPDIVRPAGPIDPDVSVVSFETPRGEPVAAYVNFAMHPDTVGGDGISADYPGVLSRLLADCKGTGMVTIFANGCCGNLNHRDIRWPDPQHGPHEARRIGTVLAGTVCRTYPLLRTVKADGLRVKSSLVKLPLAPQTAEDVDRAREVVKRGQDPKVPFLDKVKAYRVLDVAARDGKPLEVEVQVIALGDRVAWVSLPGEIFVELGLAVKKASPFPYPLLAELANGSVGYVPDRPAYEQGNYEVVSARCAAGSGEMLVETAVRLLRELAPAAPEK
jgi:neutral ceramidase